MIAIKIKNINPRILNTTDFQISLKNLFNTNYLIQVLIDFKLKENVK